MSEVGPTIQDADGEETVAHARRLFRLYAEEHAATIAEILCFQGFEDEVTGLPGRYAPPSGCLLLAMEGDRPAGCVAIRDLGGGTCEMKRLYVLPEFRGRGLGRRLVAEVLRRAGAAGYRRMLLDTMPEMAEAIALYRSFGFGDTAPYGSSPDGRAVYMEKPLVGRHDEAP